MKIQQALREVEEQFPDVGKLEFQVRPAVPESAAILEAGGVAKPPGITANAISRLDLALGADPAGLGRVGVYKPVKPPESFIRTLTPGERSELEALYTKRQAQHQSNNGTSSTEHRTVTRQ